MRSIAHEAADERASISPSQPLDSSRGDPRFVPEKIPPCPATQRPRLMLGSALAKFFGGSHAAPTPGTILQDSAPNRQHQWERRLLPPETCFREIARMPH